jgi:predicted DNA-binding transcriptional regulator YafY
MASTNSPPTPRWGIEQRLAFIAARLGWEGRINRADLVSRFGVSPNQATNDLRLFGELNPGAMRYDPAIRAYCPDAELPPRSETDVASLLQELRLIAEGVTSANEGTLAHPPLVAIADAPNRRVPANVLGAVLTAIRERRRLSATYRSFNTPEPSARVLEPHALVFDGFRWHARALDVETGTFKDFVLGRMRGPKLLEQSESSSADDVEWNSFVTLEIGPNPSLSSAQRAAVELDYGMTDGALALEVRKAILFYVCQRLGLGPGDSGPETRHLIRLDNLAADQNRS